MLAGALVSSNPIGWGFSAGITIGAGFNWVYDNNILGVQDKLDWAGDKINDLGDSISGALDWINPF